MLQLVCSSQRQKESYAQLAPREQKVVQQVGRDAGGVDPRCGGELDLRKNQPK